MLRYIYLLLHVSKGGSSPRTVRHRCRFIEERFGDRLRRVVSREGMNVRGVYFL